MNSLNMDNITKLEEIMDKITINGFHFHDVEVEKTYEWNPLCGPQPLDEVEEVIAYRGEDIMTYYFVSDTHLRTSELINPRVDWAALNEKCRQDMTNIMNPNGLKRYMAKMKFADSLRKDNRYIVSFLQIILQIYNDVTDIYDQMLEQEVTSNAHYVKTCSMKNADLTFATQVMTMPFEDWLKKYGMNEYRKMHKIDKKSTVVVLANKDLTKEDYNYEIPYATDWRELK